MYPWPLASGKNGQQVVDVLQKNVELAGAHWSNGWCVDCETYQSVASMGRYWVKCTHHYSTIGGFLRVLQSTSGKLVLTAANKLC